MKHLATGILSSLLLSTVGIVSIVKADTIEVTPFQLVYLARDGYFADQGISKGSRLVYEYRSGQITTKDLIRAAVNDKRLTVDTLNNHKYMNTVMEEMQGLSKDVH